MRAFLFAVVLIIEGLRRASAGAWKNVINHSLILIRGCQRETVSTLTIDVLPINHLMLNSFKMFFVYLETYSSFANSSNHVFACNIYSLLFSSSAK